MELLRLIHGDNFGLRDIAPFFMLDQDRDEDAYNFVKWWLTADPCNHWAHVPESQPGEWLYLRDQVCLRQFTFNGHFFKSFIHNRLVVKCPYLTKVLAFKM